MVGGTHRTGLAEHFIYLNDDFILMRAADPTDWFPSSNHIFAHIKGWHGSPPGYLYGSKELCEVRTPRIALHPCETRAHHREPSSTRRSWHTPIGCWIACLGRLRWRRFSRAPRGSLGGVTAAPSARTERVGRVAAAEGRVHNTRRIPFDARGSKNSTRSVRRAGGRRVCRSTAVVCVRASQVFRDDFDVVRHDRFRSWSDIQLMHLYFHYQIGRGRATVRHAHAGGVVCIARGCCPLPTLASCVRR